jgi:hypothetical protein
MKVTITFEFEPDPGCVLPPEVQAAEIVRMAAACMALPRESSALPMNGDIPTATGATVGAWAITES